MRPYFPMLFFPLSLFLILAACSPTPHKAYRQTPPSEAGCTGDPIDLGWRNRETNPEQSGGHPKCYLQQHRLPSLQSQDSWGKLARDEDKPLKQSDEYHLAFVEMADRGKLHIEKQLADLQTHLAKQNDEKRQNYVVAFVHGWRHDAEVGDGDVRKFRVILGYTRAALNTRCIAKGTYCNTVLTGVFISWRGKALKEPRKNPLLAKIIAVSTFADRSEQSTNHGTPGGLLEKVLKSIQVKLQLDSGNPMENKFLIYGHSFGGNMLAVLMKERSLNVIRGNWHAGEKMRPAYGDLVVLINPASASSNWTAIQMALRKKAGLRRGDTQIAIPSSLPTRSKLYMNISRWKRMFPANQRPIYISLTASSNWNNNETQGRDIGSDEATRTAFSLAKLPKGPAGYGETVAIGHRDPEYLGASKTRLKGEPVGTSHEFIVGRGARRATTYRRAAIPRLSWCDPADGWLLAARNIQVIENKQTLGKHVGENWDHKLELTKIYNSIYNPAPGKYRNTAKIQWRHALYLKGQGNRRSVASGHSPFWNLRAFDTALFKHGGYKSYPMWCAINQLVLDDVTNIDAAETIQGLYFKEKEQRSKSEAGKAAEDANQ